MDDFIKRSDALKVIESANRMVSRLLEATMQLCVTMDRIAAADVAPVVRATNQSTGGFLCSACSFGDFGGFNGYAPRYCPNCGALMDKDGDEDV